MTGGKTRANLAAEQRPVGGALPARIDLAREKEVKLCPCSGHADLRVRCELVNGWKENLLPPARF